MATTAVLAIVMSSHENTGTAICLGTLSSKTLDLAITINFVVFEDSQLGLLSLMLDLLRSCVHLLLSLLSATTETKY
jgi:hypothetical protein